MAASDLVQVQTIADRGVNEAHVPLTDLQAMFAGISALALDMRAEDAAASMRTFTCAPQKGLAGAVPACARSLQRDGQDLPRAV